MRSITALMLREMSTKYGRTPGGYVWAILEPVGGIVVMALVFSVLLRSPQLGNSFILYYASGFLPFTLYMTVQTAVQTSISFSRPLLMYPAVSWIDALIARFLLNVLTGVLVMIVVLVGVLQFVTVTTIFEFWPMIEASLLCAILAAGLGVLNCVLMGLFPLWGNVWGIATRPIFILAGVIFLYENLPPSLQDILWYTPWIHLTAMFRTGVYPTYQPDFISVPLVLAWSLLPLILGLILLRRYYQEILLR